MSTTDSLRDTDFRQLRACLHALAVAGSDGPALFPELAPNADALAREFDRCASLIRSTYPDDLSAEQTEALTALERKLATMSRDGAEFDADLWTEAALRGSEHWMEVRKLASLALDVLR